MKRAIILLLLILPVCLNAQNTMYFMDRLPQTISYNPAFVPDIKFYLGLPGIGGLAAHAYNSGFNYESFEKFNDNVRYQGYNPDEFINSIGAYNKFFTEARANLFSMGFKLKGKGYFSMSLTMNNSTVLKAASDFAYLFVDPDNLSNSIFPLKVDEVDFSTTNYLSLGFTYSRLINEHLTVGVSPHINFNIFGLKTTYLSYIVNKEEFPDSPNEYDRNFKGEVMVGLPVELNPDAIDGEEFDLDQGLLADEWGEDLNVSKLLKNKSLAFDFGAVYALNKWTFSASILNIGASGWKTNGYILSGNNETISIKKPDKIRISLPTKIYIAANRQFSQNWNYGLVVNNSFYSGVANTSATFSLNGVIGKMLSTSLSYTAGYKFNNIGLGFRLRFFPGTDLYFVTDNIIQSLNYKKANRLSAAFGVNLSFGIKKDSIKTNNITSPVLNN